MVEMIYLGQDFVLYWYGFHNFPKREMQIFFFLTILQGKLITLSFGMKDDYYWKEYILFSTNWQKHCSDSQYSNLIMLNHQNTSVERPNEDKY